MRWIVRAVPVVLLLASITAVLAPRGAETLPLFSSRTGLMCQTCHFDPNGGGPRNEFGFAFARNRHSLEAEPDSTSEWHDLNVQNRVGESVPIYFGINHRLLLLANSTIESDSLDRFGFFNMENAIHIAFQPHRRLALVHTRDGGVPKESFGWIGGFPYDGYVKLGQFRNPFGLRMDDHTTATRNGFLDLFEPTFPVGLRYLPYDPRLTDTGIEIGASASGLYGRLAFTNGEGSHPLFSPNRFAEAKSIKVGFLKDWYQGGVSFYDEYNKAPFPLGTRRATRWAYLGLVHYGPFVVLGEAGAGTDVLESGDRVNLLAGFGELNYHPTRALNFRARFDYLNTHRDRSLTTGTPIAVPISDLNTHHRYALEGEIVPVPFAELRWTLRYIDHRADRDPFDVEIEDERQAYLQFHFSY